MNKTQSAFINPANKTILTCFSLQAVGIGVYIAFGVFFNPLMDQFGWPRAVISGASSMAFFISGLFAIYVGRFYDRIGPKYIMTITAVFFGLGLILMSRINAIWHLYIVFGLIFGIGLSSVDVIALTTIARWFPEKRGSITGIVKVGTGAGQFFFPFLASILIAGVGWRNAYMILGGISLLAMLLIAQILRKDPEQNDQNKDAIVPAQGDPQFNSKTLNSSSDVDLSFFQASRTVQFWLLCIVNFTIVFCLMSVLVHIVPYGRDIGVSVHKAAGVLSTIGLVSMAGRFITGMIIDRIGSKRSMLMALVILIAAFSWLQTADALWKLYVFAGIYGLAHGSFFTVISPIVAELFGTRAHGSLFGLLVFFGTTGGAFGPFLVGYLFDLNGTYGLPFGLILIISLLGMGMLAFLKPVMKASVFQPGK